jgi:hypothetical protein
MPDDALPRSIPFEFAGVAFELRVRREPSGLAGRIFHGEEQVAGVRLYHSEDLERLQALALKDRALLRAAQRYAGSGR